MEKQYRDEFYKSDFVIMEQKVSRKDAKAQRKDRMFSLRLGVFA